MTAGKDRYVARRIIQRSQETSTVREFILLIWTGQHTWLSYNSGNGAYNTTQVTGLYAKGIFRPKFVAYWVVCVNQ